MCVVGKGIERAGVGACVCACVWCEVWWCVGVLVFGCDFAPSAASLALLLVWNLGFPVSAKLKF